MHNGLKRLQKIERVRPIYEKYQQGSTLAALALENNISRQRVHQLIKDYEKLMICTERDMQDMEA